MLSALDDVKYVSAGLQSPLAMVKTDICKMPFPSESFDAVFCMHVLQYVPDDRQGIAELFRVVKPGAWAIVQVPIDWDRAKTFEDTSCYATKRQNSALAFGGRGEALWPGFHGPACIGGVHCRCCVLSKALSADTIAAYGLKASDDRKVWVCAKPRSAQIGLLVAPLLVDNSCEPRFCDIHISLNGRSHR